MANITGRAKELFEKGKNFITISTKRDDGKPQMNVIWGDLDESGRIAVNSAEGRQWPANVRRDPEVALIVVNHENPYEYVQILGRVVEDTHEGADEHINGLAQKYLGQDEYPYRQEGEQRVKFLIEPEQVKVMGG
jgi:PPOX class probable F420-dependent enzyme